MCAAVVFFTLQPIIDNEWDVTTSLQAAGGLGIVMFSLWYCLNALLERARGPSSPICLIITFGGVALVLGMSGSALLGQLGGAVAAALGAAALLAFWRPSFGLGRGATPVLVTLLAGLLLNGYFYAGLMLPCAALLALSPLAAWVGELEGIRTMTKFRAGLIQVAVALFFVLPAVLLALGEFMAAEPY